MNRELARARAERLVAQMTVAEAASQLRYDAPAIERLNVPAYNWWNEALHGVARAGVATSFPQAIGLAATFDPALVQALGDVAATEGRAKYNSSVAEGDRSIYKGLTYWSPNINIFRDPRWGRGHETYGEDPFLTGEMGAAYVRGLQGEGEHMKAAACAKHFAVHSGPEALRHQFNAKVSEKDLRETYLPAFEKLVREAKVEAVMGAYNRVNDQPCCGSPRLLGDILRGEWGFEGHVVSDCGAIQDFHRFHQITDTPEDSAALAIESGCDLNCGLTYAFLMKAYEQGKVSEEAIRRAAVRLFTTRFLLGILGGSEFDRIGYEALEAPEHLQRAHQAALESCVLLKNDGMLPLDPDALKAVAVIGPNANSRAALVGNYHGTSSRYVTVLEGIQDELVGRARVYYAEGCALARDRVESCAGENDRLSEAVQAAKHADAVILVLGLDETLEGEAGDASNASASGDKWNLLLPESQRLLLRAVLEAGRPTAICLMAGSAIDLQEGNQANAVLLTWYPGARGGRAVAELLFGRHSPSGKLPVTFYRNEQLRTLPDFTDYSMKGRTYRYLKEAPLYPFGFGLTYGDVSVQDARADWGNAQVTVEAHLRNDGARDTWEVLEVYCQNEGSAFAPDHPRLCGCARVFCPAGACVTARVSIDRRQLLVVNDRGERVEDGEIALWAGTGQSDSLTASLTGHDAVRVQ